MKAINAGILAFVMALCVCLATVVAGHAETEQFRDVTKTSDEPVTAFHRLETEDADETGAILLSAAAGAAAQPDTKEKPAGFVQDEQAECTDYSDPENVSGEYLCDIPLSAEEQVALYNACCEFDVPFGLAVALIWQETDFQNLVGDNGNSLGYMQIQPRWVQAEMAELGIYDLMVPADNFRMGCYLLGTSIPEYGVEQALTKYNTGSPGWSVYACEVMEKWNVLVATYD